MPILVADWQKKFDELVASKKLPKTATPERVEELRGKLAEVNATWTKATDAYNAGDIKAALENGSSVKAAVDWMQTAWDALQPAKK
jgi:predicted S18 family serine protease